MLTDQSKQANAALLDAAWAHLAVTMRKSVSPHDTLCKYGGSGCAFSVALVDGQADRCEGKGAGQLLLGHPEVIKPEFLACSADFVLEVQRAHDRTLYEEGVEFLEEFQCNIFKDVSHTDLPVGYALPWIRKGV